VAVVLLSSVIASLIWAKDADMDIDVDLPEDFDSPFEDDEVEPEKKLDETDVAEETVSRFGNEIKDEIDSQNEELENIERR
jgi:hypothetical protein